MADRIWRGRKGRLILVRYCIECPGMPKCTTCYYRNYKPTSGPIPAGCRLRRATEKESVELEKALDFS